MNGSQFLNGLAEVFGSTEAMSGILGAILGGAATIVGQWVTIRSSRNTEREKRKSQDIAVASSLLFKCLVIYSNIKLINDFLKNPSQGIATGLSSDAKFWEKLVPIANPPEKIFFTSEEMSLLLQYKMNDTFNNMMRFDDRHNGLITSLLILFSEKEKIVAAIQNITHDGSLMSSMLSVKDMANITPGIVKIESLSGHMMIDADGQEEEFRTILITLHSELVNKIGISYKMTLH